MKSIRIVEEEIAKLIRVVFIPYPIYLGNFTLIVLKNILPKVKDKLNLDFDEIEVYPGPQPRESADIELYRDGKIIKKINVKTSISGNLKRTLYNLYKSRKYGEDGLIIVFMSPRKMGETLPMQMVIIYIPSEIFQKFSRTDIIGIIENKLDEKIIKEGFDSLNPIAVNEAIMFELAYKAIIAAEKAEKAFNEAREAREEARKAREEAEKAFNEARKAREISEKLLNISKVILEMLKGES